MATTIASSQGFWRVSGNLTGFAANRPMSSVEKVADRLHAKPFGFGNVLNLLASRTAANKVGRHFARNLGQPVTVLRARTQAAFRDFVGAVVGGSSKPQMVRIHAGGRVAPMQDVKFAGFRNVKRIREAVRQDGPLFSAASKASVPCLINGCAPKPATRHGVMVNVRHKAINAVHRITVSIRTATVK